MIVVFSLLFVILFFYSIIYNTGNIRKLQKDRNYLIICGIAFMVVYMFKNNSCFPDLDYYFYLYNKINTSSWGAIIKEGCPIPGFNTDWGYCVYNKALCMLNSNTAFLVFCNSLIILLGYFVFIGRYSQLKIMSLVLFLFG